MQELENIKQMVRELSATYDGDVEGQYELIEYIDELIKKDKNEK